MAEVIVLVFLAAAVAFWGYRAARRKKHRAARVANRQAHKSYHCVEIWPGNPSCEAAQKLAMVRFLSDEAPALPVPGCRVERCSCHYIHHDDRREEDDRRNPFGMWANVPPMLAGERRNRAGRRQARDNTIRPLLTR